jgi:DNA-3-methyladenine glycosylase
MKVLPQNFYNQPTLKVAQDLLGCFLVRKVGNKVIKTKIVETEAYSGPHDLASHASRGRTPRNEVMFGEPGIIYVYFTYGMHYMLNIVTEKENYPAAVLIRAVEPVNRITNYELSPPEAGPPRAEITNLKTNGPAKLTKYLRINKKFNGRLIYTKKYGLWIAGRDEDIKSAQIIKRPRVGVDYAGKYKNKKWRFYLRGNKFISKK